MDTYRIQTRFGPVDVRLYRLREGWWPVPVGRHRLPSTPVLPDAELPQSAEAALRRMTDLIDALPSAALVPGQLKLLLCGDVVRGCPRTFRGTEDEILREVAAHAAADHGMAVVPDAVVARVLASMTTVG